jgi:hypothetical protein
METFYFPNHSASCKLNMLLIAQAGSKGRMENKCDGGLSTHWKSTQPEPISTP